MTTPDAAKNELKATNFRQLLQECESIRIPEIQRDYAQGRTNDLAAEVREGFLGDLLPVLQGDGHRLSLDYIYGYKKEGAFEPLDGQQRLTTLFILHWMFSPTGNSDLKLGSAVAEAETRSRFRYSTRISSGEFCDALVRQDARTLIDFWRKTNQEEEDESKRLSFAGFIKELAWFKWTWRYDPTIAAILNMMDGVLGILDRYGIDFKVVRYESLDQIVFHWLDLDDVAFLQLRLKDGFKLGEELYVKMNSRGKGLSEFDKLKSTLEEEIQFQKEEGLASDDLECNWRSRMDGNWADYFWQTKDISVDKALPREVVDGVETVFLRFLSRIIAFSLLDDLKKIALCAEAMGAYRRRLESLCASVNDADVLVVVREYVRAIRYARQKKLAFPRINFGNIQKLLDCIIVDLGDRMSDVTYVACPGFRWSPDDNCSKSLLREFIEHGLSHERRIEFFALTTFICEMNVTSASVFPEDANLCEDFREWIRFVRNCALLQNQQSVRIDSFEDEWTACSTLLNIIRLFAGKKRNPAVGSSLTFRSFLVEYEEEMPTVGLDQECVKEEILKARLCKDTQWNTFIELAEDNSYLWGQLRALLNWSANGNGHEVGRFKKYADKITALLPVTDGNLRDKVWKALLCLRDYRFAVANRQTLITFDGNRDVSWKRYLRHADANGVNAPILKEFVDLWLQPNNDAFSREAFLDHLIAEQGPRISDWRKFVIYGDKLSTECCPSMGILIDDNKSGIMGHKWFVPRKRVGASYRSYEILICYLYYCPKCAGVKVDEFCDSLEPDVDKKNSILLSNGKLRVRVQAVDGGKYVYSEQNKHSKVDADSVMFYLQNIDILPKQSNLNIPMLGSV